jgi:hypothetical protein
MSESQGFLVHLQRLVVASQLTVHGGQVAHACALECRKDALDMGHRALDFRERPLSHATLEPKSERHRKRRKKTRGAKRYLDEWLPLTPPCKECRINNLKFCKRQEASDRVLTVRMYLKFERECGYEVTEMADTHMSVKELFENLRKTMLCHMAHHWEYTHWWANVKLQTILMKRGMAKLLCDFAAGIVDIRPWNCNRG